MEIWKNLKGINTYKRYGKERDMENGIERYYKKSELMKPMKGRYRERELDR